MKRKFYDRYLNTMCVFLFFGVAAGIVAICLKNYFVAAASGVLLLVYVSVLIAASVKKKDKSYFGQSLAVTGASVIVIAVSPLALLLWIFQRFLECFTQPRAKK